MRRKLTQRGKERRRQLMDQAAELFAERGYHPTSVADIVESLGVGKGVFYWYFSSKEELLAEILKSSHQELRRRQQQAIADEPNPVERIRLGIRASMQWFFEHRKYFTLFQFAASDERFAPALRRNQEVAIGDAVRHIKDGIVEGQIADQDPEVLAQAVLGVVEQLTQTYIFERNDSVERAADAAVAFCLHGLCGD
jgi:AcrR family transcriptional regulator